MSKESRKAAQKEWYLKVVRLRREQWFKNNGPCKTCYSWDNLEVDHIDPFVKVHHGVWSWSESRRLKELAKCQPLCRSCHKRKTLEHCRRIDIWASLRKDGPPGTSWCNRCSAFLLVGKFTKNPSERNGLDGQCKDCRSRRRSPNLWNGDKRILRSGRVSTNSS